MDGNSDWRNKLASLLASLQRIWGLKSRVALGATIASALVSLPATSIQARPASPDVVQAAPRKPGKLSAKFMLHKADGTRGKALAEHGSHKSHSSHSSHSSHRSGAWLL